MSKPRPIIGITAGYDYEKNTMYLNEGYYEAVYKCGGLAVAIPPSCDEKVLLEFLNICDGILLSGGADIDAKLYGESNMPYNGDISPIRDALEIFIAKMTVEMNKPLLGICRGIQVLNVQLTGIRYSPVFVTSVENAVKAKAMAVQAENTVLQKKYEGEQMTVTAKAQADARIEAARGEAQSTLLEAQAQAKAIQMVGQAIQENPHYVEFYSVKQWNGILPTYMGGGAPVPFVKVPQASHSSN